LAILGITFTQEYYMAILDFPPNPVVDDVYIADSGVHYIYNGYAWEVDVLSMSTGPAGPQGPQGEPGTPADMTRVEALEARCDALEARCTALEAELAAINWPYLA
jgi:hypothetical protein